jgi:hypothetical protein
VYEPNIPCTNFGAIYIETAHHVEPWDDIYVVGRDRSFMQHLFESPENTLLPASTSASLLENLKSFDDVLLQARSVDFPDYPEEVFPSVRPHSAALKSDYFHDTFMPLSNLKFLTYLKGFPSDQLFIASLAID